MMSRLTACIIAVATIALTVVATTIHPPALVQLGLAALASAAVLGLNRGALRLGETFPELARLPLGRWFL